MNPKPESGADGTGDLPGPANYPPEIWSVKKDVIYAAISAVESGIEYARECLAVHNTSRGKTTFKNKTWAERMETDIRQMTHALEMLRACNPTHP